MVVKMPGEATTKMCYLLNKRQRNLIITDKGAVCINLNLFSFSYE